MWNYYCPKCNKNCDHEEMELQEDMFEGDWVEFHRNCGTKLVVSLKLI
ncbi:hypothetical protein [Bacillus paranthracis]